MSKRLGQNFLTSKAIARRIAEAADIKLDDVILEIGPGKGILTEAILAKNPKKLIAVEKDKKLVDFLQENFSVNKNLEIVEGDILEDLNSKIPFDPELRVEGQITNSKQTPKSKFKIPNANYKIVANIPYYITSRLLRLIFSQKNLPEKIVLMLQREVAERICAKPPRMNMLALSVQVYGRPKITFRVSGTFFRPRPKVDSAVIVIDNISRDFFQNFRLAMSEDGGGAEKNFFDLLHAGFRHKRKMLLKNLANYTPGVHKGKWVVWFGKCGINEKARAENLALENWGCLIKNIF